MAARLAALLVLLAAGGGRRADASSAFVARLPNGGSVAGVAALGHVDPAGGGALNSFGEAFKAAGLAWTVALCLADSDGDGFSNGQELGDPCCVWRFGTYPTFDTGTSDPGNSSSVVDAAILLNWICAYQEEPGSGSAQGSLGANPTPAGYEVSATTITATPTSGSGSEGVAFSAGPSKNASAVSSPPPSSHAASRVASGLHWVSLACGTMSLYRSSG